MNRPGTPLALVGAGGAPLAPPESEAAVVTAPASSLTVSRFLQSDGGGTARVAVIGGGCSGLALGIAASIAGVPMEVLEARPSHRPDPRSWCSWDDGSMLLPEAVSASWTTWEVLTDRGRTVTGDPAHPYRLVRAQDYRDAARRRLVGTTVRLHEGARVTTATTPDGRGLLHVAGEPVRADRIIDARGQRSDVSTAGNVVLHQRFLGWWVRTTRPVFNPTVATLMDFRDPRPDGSLRFFYVLPVRPDLALVEVTVFTPSRDLHQPFADELCRYLADRWGLTDADWIAEEQEAGCIAMTDLPVHAGIGIAAGDVRPSSGYAFSRIQRHARQIAADLAAGRDPQPLRDRVRTRVLDAVFLRFLRDEPESAPAMFLRLFAGLPGPLTVRFLTERSTLVDDLRVVLALPKTPFLRAAFRTALEKLGADR